MKILTLGIIASLTMASTMEAADHKQSVVTIVDSETDADATHIYLSQDDSTDSGMTKMTYDDNPKAFTQGWRDGWKWASEQNDLSSDQPAEKMEKKLYGNIDEEPAQTKAIGFFDGMTILRHRKQNQLAAGAGPEPEVSPWNGVPGGDATEKAIKDSLDDPGSYQLVRSSKPLVTTYNGTACWGTKVVYRAKNRFGALRITSTFVYLTGGDKPKVLGVDVDTSLDQD
jgi:hypothetical protein